MNYFLKVLFHDWRLSYIENHGPGVSLYLLHEDTEHPDKFKMKMEWNEILKMKQISKEIGKFKLKTKRKIYSSKMIM